MSGHSKWAQIKRQKGANDAKRGLAFTKISNAISVAVVQGGNIGDPDQNFRLRLAVEEARSVNMPKENIERAIERALKKQGAALDETVYEGFGPSGVSLIVEAATDNKNRTTAEIKSIFDKNGGTMGQSGSVAYMFKQVGKMVIDKEGKTIDDIFITAADAGAEDVKEEGENEAVIFTSPGNLNMVRQKFLAQNYIIKSMELVRVPIVPMKIEDNDSIERVFQLIEKLEDLNDVQKVYSNIDLTD